MRLKSELESLEATLDVANVVYWIAVALSTIGAWFFISAGNGSHISQQLSIFIIVGWLVVFVISYLFKSIVLGFGYSALQIAENTSKKEERK